MSGRVGRWAMVVALAAAPAGLYAQAGPTANVQAQMPVARLSHLAGSVSLQSEDGTEAPVDAALNMPLRAGQRLLAGDKGEAEIEFADGSVLRMTPGSVATLQRMDADSQGTSLDLGSGLFYLELRALDSGRYTVDAADVMISPEENASFRVRVKDGQVETAVLSGSVSVTRQNAYTAQIAAGESLRTDPRNGRRYLLADTVSPETWDDWNERLAQAAQDEQSSQTSVRDGYAGAQAYGWGDLDASGSWYNVQGEGPVWQPTVADAGFDPYGQGSWVYGPGGYTWASGYSWGWLPYRCGAWSFYSGFGWGWTPSSGCVSFGFGGGSGGSWEGGGGFRVRHPPAGWHPPHRPVLESGLGQKQHPTVPVRFRPLGVATSDTAPVRRAGEPVRVAGVVAVPVKRVGRDVTPQGGSAVGSSLLRDFPIRQGTHEPALGLVSPNPVAVPGRAAEWHRGSPPAASLTGASPGGPAPAVLVGGEPGAGRVQNGVAPGSGRLPRSTDPPFGANGAPPLGANGAPPLGANGTLAPRGVSQGEVQLRRGVSGPGGAPGNRLPMVPGTIVPVVPRSVLPVQTVAPSNAPPRPLPMSPPVAPPRVSMPSPSVPRAPSALAAPVAPRANPK